MKSKHEFQKLVGANLRKLRIEKQWTLEKLALESELTYSQVGRIELGKRNPTCFTIYLLSKVLDVDPAVFFRDNNLVP